MDQMICDVYEKFLSCEDATAIRMYLCLVHKYAITKYRNALILMIISVNKSKQQHKTNENSRSCFIASVHKQ